DYYCQVFDSSANILF
nr:immunoglobulin light chain junction region [Macaca mulatta]MOX29905.1 immunoglobulin light chain junction region [Macaca mulatta]MOX29932.1 immunoglobulin light chain junction region [Macaca mulatta]MOX30128.1 immunoglobulin light chain junction region [Macaca mulatta]MOX30138.1 immunoglobulin light chain junction region [Macaca mulatta]